MYEPGIRAWEMFVPENGRLDSQSGNSKEVGHLARIDVSEVVQDAIDKVSNGGFPTYEEVLEQIQKTHAIRSASIVNDLEQEVKDGPNRGSKRYRSRSNTEFRFKGKTLSANEFRKKNPDTGVVLAEHVERAYQQAHLRFAETPSFTEIESPVKGVKLFVYNTKHQ